MTAFQATFSDFRLVKGRKVAQLVFEVPIEAADAALQTLGGVPRPDQEAWVGIARIDPKNLTSDARKPSTEPKERRRFHELPLSQQCAMRCNEGSFQRFMAEEYKAMGAEANHVACVKQICGIESRSEIGDNNAAGTKWRQLEAEYQTWMQVPV